MTYIDLRGPEHTSFSDLRVCVCQIPCHCNPSDAPTTSYLGHHAPRILPVHFDPIGRCQSHDPAKLSLAVRTAEAPLHPPLVTVKVKDVATRQYNEFFTAAEVSEADNTLARLRDLVAAASLPLGLYRLEQIPLRSTFRCVP